MHAKNKRHLLSLIKILLAAFLLYFLIHSSRIKMGLIIALLHQPVILLQVMICFLMAILAGVWRLHLLMIAREIKLGFNQCFFATYVGSAFSNFLPSSMGGDVIKLFYIYKQVPQNKSEVTLVLFSDRLLGFMGIFALLLLVTATHLSMLDKQPSLMHLIWLCNLFCLGLLVGFFFIIRLIKRFQLSVWLEKIISAYRWISILNSFFKTLIHFNLEKIVITKCLLLSIIIQFLMTISIVLIAHMMGFPSILFSHFILAVGIIQIVNLIPLTPGGIGIGEFAFANVLLLLNPGINAAYATIYFAYRLISMLVYLPAVLLFTSRLGGRMATLPYQHAQCKADHH